jgi:tetratricopeptide (TPR) repeat protein
MAQSRFEHFTDAEKSFRRALELQQPLLDAQPDDAKTLSDAGGMYNNLGLLFDRLRRFDDADAAYKQAIRLQRAAFDGAPDVRQYRKLLHNHYVNYAKSLRIQNKGLDADKVSQERNTLFAGSL